MSNPYLDAINPVKTPQSSPLPGREPEMARNHAGGYAFLLTPWQALDRFLILGTEGGTYYATEREHTLDSIANLRRAIAEDGPRVVARIVKIDAANRAPKMKPILFALAACHVLGDLATKQVASAALPAILRTGTHFFLYLSYLAALGSKLSRNKRSALSNWLASQEPDRLAYQMAKYANREGWTWRDALRVIHPTPRGIAQRALYRWAVRGASALTRSQLSALPDVIIAAEKAKNPATTEKQIIRLIVKEGLTHEMIPSERQSPAVLAALAERMPATALLRQLARLTAAGVLPPLSDLGSLVAARIVDAEWLRKSRVHPIQILSALVVYGSGHGVRGALTWSPNQEIVAALEEAFYTSFESVEPTNKRTLLALDVSGSMGEGNVAGVPGLTPAMASACLAMVVARTEPHHHIMGFSSTFRDLGVTSRDSLSDALRKTSGLTFGSTDCALPALWANSTGSLVDAFVILTDNETWVGRVHPSAALADYRKARDIPARQIVVGMTSTRFTIADPRDPLSLDVVGFDAAAPAIMADFIRG